jgi:hypothetical protein
LEFKLTGADVSPMPSNYTLHTPESIAPQVLPSTPYQLSEICPTQEQSTQHSRASTSKALDVAAG